MTINELLEEVDYLRPNAYSEEQKIKWLNIVEKQIYEEILLTHEVDVPAFTGYTTQTGKDTALLMNDTYGHDVYCFYLESCIDRENAEWGKYNQSVSLFNTAYHNAANFYNRSFMPKSKGNAFLI